MRNMSVFADVIDTYSKTFIPFIQDSYVLRWFNDVDQYLSVGAPVYFVVKDGYDYVPIENQNLICGAMGCDEQSLVGQIFKASQQANG